MKSCRALSRVRSVLAILAISMLTAVSGIGETPISHRAEVKSRDNSTGQGGRGSLCADTGCWGIGSKVHMIEFEGETGASAAAFSATASEVEDLGFNIHGNTTTHSGRDACSIARANRDVTLEDIGPELTDHGRRRREEETRNAATATLSGCGEIAAATAAAPSDAPATMVFVGLRNGTSEEATGIVTSFINSPHPSRHACGGAVPLIRSYAHARRAPSIGHAAGPMEVISSTGGEAAEHAHDRNDCATEPAVAHYGVTPPIKDHRALLLP